MEHGRRGTSTLTTFSGECASAYCMFHGHDRSLSVLYVARWYRVRRPVPAGIQTPHSGAAWEPRPRAFWTARCWKACPKRHASRPRIDLTRIPSFGEVRPGFLTLGRFHQQRAVTSPCLRGTPSAPKRQVFAMAGAAHFATLHPQVRVQAPSSKPQIDAATPAAPHGFDGNLARGNYVPTRGLTIN